MSRATGSFAHGFTYSGHPVACAVAIEALKLYRYVCRAALSRTRIRVLFICLFLTNGLQK